MRHEYSPSDALKYCATAGAKILGPTQPAEIDGEKLSILERSPQDLKESQWWVEDVAQTEGNNRSLVIARRLVEPIAAILTTTTR